MVYALPLMALFLSCQYVCLGVAVQVRVKGHRRSLGIEDSVGPAYHQLLHRMVREAEARSEVQIAVRNHAPAGVSIVRPDQFSRERSQPADETPPTGCVTSMGVIGFTAVGSNHAILLKRSVGEGCSS